MKRVLSLLLIFIIIFSIVVASILAINMNKVSVSESSSSKVLGVGSYKESEEVKITADFTKEGEEVKRTGDFTEEGEEVKRTGDFTEEGEEVKRTANSAEDFYLSYHCGYTLLKNGKLKEFSDKNRIISEKIPVDNNSIYIFKNLSAKYGNCFYVIYNSNNEAISYLRATESTTGEVIERINIIMPEDASYFRLACDLNVNNKMFEAAKSYTESNSKRSEPAIISFTDDDCRSEVYTELYPLIKELNLPYTLACPPDSLDDQEGKYMTTEQLKELYANGVDVVSHHLKEYAMTEFESIEDYENDTKACLEKFNNMGIEVNGVSYPNGRINEDYMPVVKEYFKHGFTTDRGINTLPYESYYIDRCEIFPKSGIYNIDDAKALVDSVAENGGWLVFMTHCWFETFSSEELKELVDYIRCKNIEVANVTDVIENYANPIDIGIVKKPLTDMTEDFFVVDCMGRAYTNNIAMTNIETNNMTIIEKSTIKWNEIPINYNIATTLLPSGKEKDHFLSLEGISKEEQEKQISQRKRNVSDIIYVTPNRTYKLTNMSAKYGNCFYVIYDTDNNVISYQGIPDSSTGETLDEIIITMPSNASYLKMACDLNVNNKMFKVYSESIKGDEDKTMEELYLSYHTGYTLLKNGKLKEFSDKNRIISEKITVDNNSIYYFKNISAKYGNCLLVIYDNNNNVISYQGTSDSSTGETIDEIIITMPSNASYFRLACDLNVNDKMFEAYRTNKR